MKPPRARPVPPSSAEADRVRAPRSFAVDAAENLPDVIEPLTAGEQPAQPEVARPPRFLGLLGKLAWGAGGLLVSLALGLAADSLIRDLFARNELLGWAGLVFLAVFVLAVVALAIREVLALARLRSLDATRRRAIEALETDRHDAGKAVIGELEAIYAGRADLARASERLNGDAPAVFDGSELVRLAERTLMAPLDLRARALTAASARRVALVTTVSPRALIDIAFVVFESVRLGGDIAKLYGARPGAFGTLRLMGAILSHLAVTGGLVLTDGVMEQLVGQGLAAKLSARLGEGIVNGLMTVRVGIAAMRVVRPLPFAVRAQPMVRDFIPELANVLKEKPPQPAGN